MSFYLTLIMNNYILHSLHQLLTKAATVEATVSEQKRQRERERESEWEGERGRERVRKRERPNCKIISGGIQYFSVIRWASEILNFVYFISLNLYRLLKNSSE